MTRSILAAIVIAGLTACGNSNPEPATPSLELDSAVTLHADTDAPIAPDIIEPVGEEVALTEPTITPGAEPAPEVEATPEVPLATFELRRGETLAHFARWAELPVEDIAETSELELDGSYAVGTEIALAVDPETRAQIETRRDTHHRVRAENYLASRGSTGTEFYSVRTGDSAWTIARDRQGMPVWLLESLNPSANLDRLRPGDSLLVPVFNDIVAEAPSEPSVELAEEPSAEADTVIAEPELEEAPARETTPEANFFVIE